MYQHSRGTAHESIVPYQAFECKDGMYMVGAGNDKQVWVALNANEASLALRIQQSIN